MVKSRSFRNATVAQAKPLKASIRVGYQGNRDDDSCHRSYMRGRFGSETGFTVARRVEAQ